MWATTWTRKTPAGAQAASRSVAEIQRVVGFEGTSGAPAIGSEGHGVGPAGRGLRPVGGRLRRRGGRGARVPRGDGGGEWGGPGHGTRRGGDGGRLLGLGALIGVLVGGVCL